MKLYGLALAAMALTGCASSVMNGFVGKPIQEVMVRYGQPNNAFDMGDGRRAFQWSMSNTYVTPVTSTTTGNAYAYGPSVAWTQNTQISGGVPITNTCAYTMFGRWSGASNTWIMESFQKPKLACE